MVGLFVTCFASPWLWQVVEQAELDFGVIDLEHGPLGMDDVSALLAGARGTSISAFVRIAASEQASASRLLDIGADGLILAQADDPERVREFTRACRYAPEGNRGVSFGFPHDGFSRLPWKSVAAKANTGVSCIALIESAAGIRKVHEIAKIPGIDGLWLGFADLAQSLGCHEGDMGFDEAEQVVLDAARVAGIPAGIVAGTPEAARNALVKGYSIIALGTDTSLLQDALISRRSALLEVDIEQSDGRDR